MIIIFTTALIDDYYDTRKTEYIESFNISKDLIGLDNIHVLECYIEGGDTFLNDLTTNIFFSKTNNDSKNKGVKEAKALIKFFENNEIDDDEIIIKQTGRYKFISDLFFKNLNETSDVNVLYGENNNCFFGMFSMKCKHFKRFINNLNLEEMERNMISIEALLSRYIAQENLSVEKHEKIDVLSNINNNHLVIW
jgi:hypothetical protein